jgi:hypothetical protein
VAALDSRGSEQCQWNAVVDTVTNTVVHCDRVMNTVVHCDRVMNTVVHCDHVMRILYYTVTM